jgi:rhodanese-related sulfurtransferase
MNVTAAPVVCRRAGVAAFAQVFASVAPSALASSPLRRAASPRRAFRPSPVAMTSLELISPREAYARKTSAPGGWKHLDVRTAGEFADGRPTEAVNVPFLTAGPAGMIPNPTFPADVAAAVAADGGKDAKLVVSCATGKRSALACAALEADGFSSLADVEGGYSAWARDESLPVESG